MSMIANSSAERNRVRVTFAPADRYGLCQMSQCIWTVTYVCILIS